MNDKRNFQNRASVFMLFGMSMITVTISACDEGPEEDIHGVEEAALVEFNAENEEITHEIEPLATITLETGSVIELYNLGNGTDDILVAETVSEGATSVMEMLDLPHGTDLVGIDVVAAITRPEHDLPSELEDAMASLESSDLPRGWALDAALSELHAPRTTFDSIPCTYEAPTYDNVHCILNNANTYDELVTVSSGRHRITVATEAGWRGPVVSYKNNCAGSYVALSPSFGSVTSSTKTYTYTGTTDRLWRTQLLVSSCFIGVPCDPADLTDVKHEYKNFGCPPG